jgi:hypothetical protein
MDLGVCGVLIGAMSIFLYGNLQGFVPKVILNMCLKAKYC